MERGHSLDLSWLSIGLGVDAEIRATKQHVSGGSSRLAAHSQSYTKQKALLPLAMPDVAAFNQRQLAASVLHARSVLLSKDAANFLDPAVPLSNTFQFIKALGAGTCGRVSLWMDTSGKRVAIKESSGSLEKEFEIGLALNHPNISKTYNLATKFTDNRLRHYLIMEYVEGSTKANYVRNKPITAEMRNQLTDDVVSALDHMRKMNVVPVDVIADNVMITKDGHWKFIDFGSYSKLNVGRGEVWRAPLEQAVDGTPTRESVERWVGRGAAESEYALARRNLLLAVRKGHLESFRNDLSEYPELVDVTNTIGMNLFKIALLSRHLAIAVELLANGATVDSTGYRGLPPILAIVTDDKLSKETMSGWARLVTALAGRGVDVNAIDDDGRHPLVEAAMRHRRELVCALLDSGATPPSDWGFTALMAAAAAGRSKRVAELMANGADVNAQFQGGFTPLFYAVMAMSLGAVTLLLANGSKRNLRIGGLSPLQLAKKIGAPRRLIRALRTP